MFTGLIEEVGAVRDLTDRRGSLRITVSAPKLAPRLKTGDSIAVSGVCLTALDPREDSFQADLAAETVACTSLSRLSVGALVNLELPTRAGTPLGGHVVQGHVDGTAKLLSLEQNATGADWRLDLDLSVGLERYVVAKGSVAIEGVSFTVAAVEGRRVTVAIIPHTYSATNLRSLQPGDPLNIEVDVLAKYAERRQTPDSALTVEWLMEQGF